MQIQRWTQSAARQHRRRKKTPLVHSHTCKRGSTFPLNSRERERARSETLLLLLLLVLLMLFLACSFLLVCSPFACITAPFHTKRCIGTAHHLRDRKAFTLLSKHNICLHGCLICCHTHDGRAEFTNSRPQLDTNALYFRLRLSVTGPRHSTAKGNLLSMGHRVQDGHIRLAVFYLR